MAKFLPVAAVALSLAAFSVAAYADQTITFTGVVYATFNAPLGASLGDTFTESYTIKNGATNAGNSQHASYYSQASHNPSDVSVIIQFNNHTITSATPVLNDPITQNDDIAVSADNVDDPSSHDHLQGSVTIKSGGVFTNISSYVYLSGPSNTVPGPLTSIAPTITGSGLTDISQWEFTDFDFAATNANGGSGQFGGKITSISSTITGSATVPEPAPIAAFGMGLLGVFGLALRKRKTVSMS
ncbi:hypothetical protein CCAX7_14690 [Capsulimonas corticalis]|uniref:Ice-binding protein C-terminal domain-containing protein n=1 Tax=Capsulimonas corticalis TaxID=2219043 RepID=A0A402CZH0_9BACT|nr:PEP-CTERM sorting domain-containing protein [Capsulimonas corticalis]BDI29418.1 hypothetical protein CCAX7_14690 [Capsulimonas corticalis]